MIYLKQFILLMRSSEIKLTPKEKRKRKKFYNFYLCFGGLITKAKIADPTDIKPITINSIR